MARLLGDRFLPDVVTQKREQLRERLLDIRDPIRRMRARTVPGPNLIGEVEGTVTDYRDRFVTRDSVLEMIRTRREDGSNDSKEEEESDDEGNGQGRGRTSDRNALV